MVRILFGLVLPGGKRVVVILPPTPEDEEPKRPIVDPVKPAFDRSFAQFGSHFRIGSNVEKVRGKRTR